MAITTCSTDNISILPSSNNENAEPSHLIQAPSTEITDVGNGNVTPQQDEEDPTIPRADGGKDAWLFLAGCFMFEGIVWGFPFSFGVFQTYYTSHPPFSTHPNGIAIIGTCATGIMYLFSPFAMYLLETYPQLRKRCSVVGLVVMIGALLGASFAETVWQLVVLQGVLFAFGGVMVYEPTMFYLDEWFIKKKGLAFGVMWSGAGVSGLIFPFLLSWLLNTYGFRTTLRVWCIILLIICPPLIHFIRPRIPAEYHKDIKDKRRNDSTDLGDGGEEEGGKGKERKVTYGFLGSWVFWILQTSNILESLGYFMPSIYLPSYTRSLNYPSYIGTLLLALLNSSSILGAITLGHLTDTLHISTIILLSTSLSTLSVFLLWGLSTSLPSLILFSIIYGIFAGGWSAIWTGMMAEVQKQEEGAPFGLLMGLWSAGRGLGAVVSGPVSEGLLRGGWRGGVGRGKMGGGYGTKYGVLMVFTGASAFGGLIGVGSRWVGRKTREKRVLTEEV